MKDQITEINVDTKRRFFALVATGDLEEISDMLRANPDIVSCRNSSGRIPLMHAAYHGRQNVCDLLLPLSDIDAVDNDGRTVGSFLINIGERNAEDTIRMSFQKSLINAKINSTRVPLVPLNSDGGTDTLEMVSNPSDIL